MIRIIIADDEPFIRDCLVRGIDWKANGFEIVKVCKNGREVVEGLDSLQPDAVITDIKMPFMDGMQVLSYIRDSHSSVHTLVISGYEEFEYVKHAIDCNADGYLLKPVDPDELLEKMKRIAETVHSERRERAWREDPKYILNRSFNGEDLNNMLDGSEDRAAEMDGLFYSVACVCLDDEDSFARAGEVLTVAEDVGKGVYFFPRIWGNHVFVMGAANAEACMHLAQRMTERAQAALRRGALESFQIAVSNPCKGLGALPHALEEAGRTMMLRSVVHSERAFFSWKNYSVEYRPFREDISAIVRAVAKKNSVQAELLLDAVFSLFERQKCSRHDIQMFAENLLFTLSEETSFAELLDKDGISAELLMKIYISAEPRALQRALSEMISSTIQEQDRAREGSVEALVATAKQFIAEHIGDTDLSLNRIAHHLNHNPSYFCYLFSNACGKTLSSYITELRIEHAQRMLRDSDFSVMEISDRLGYQNANYFGKVFKRETGMTPKEYRLKNRK